MRRGLVLLFALGMSVQASAYLSHGAHSTHKSIFDRASKAEANCLGAAYVPPPVTYDVPKGIWVDLYRPSPVSRASMVVYRPLAYGLGDWVQGVIDSSLNEDSETPYVMPTLRTLAHDARRVAEQRGFSAQQSICMASCLVNNLLDGDDEIPHMTSLVLAIADGAGDCKIWSRTLQMLTDGMGLDLGTQDSWRHAFNTFEIEGQTYFVDSTQGADECNFYPASFYD